MKITKFGHCCLLIEESGVKILTDPGNYCDTPDVSDVSVILITHEHGDHIHLPALKEILAKNPHAEIITHEGVGKLLDAEEIPWRKIVDEEEISMRGVSIKSFGTKHACIHPDLEVSRVQNTGFLVAGRLFYPGDNLHEPKIPVEIVALPVAGPWLTIEQSVEYAKRVHPKVAFPMHDGMLRQDHRLGPTRRVPQAVLEPAGIQFIDMVEGSVKEF